MKNLTLVLFLILTVGCALSQSEKGTEGLTGDVQSDLEALLPAGQVTVDILGMKQFPNQQEVKQKIQRSIDLNYDWFVGFMQNVPDGEPMPYHANLGISKAEYKDMMEWTKDPELVSIAQENLVIKNKNGKIRFEASGELAPITSFTVDADNNLVRFEGTPLEFEKTLDITDETAALKSKWGGYRWSHIDPVNPTLEMMTNRETLKMTKYTFTVGRLEKNGKTFVRLQAMEIVNGYKELQFELPITF